MAVSLTAHAMDQRSAISVAKKYSEVVACQVDGDYKAVQIDAGDADMDGLGAKFVVHWYGDVGCAGGNGTVSPQFTVVEHSGFVSADPVVMDYKFPVMKLVTLKSIKASKAGIISITGVAYGPKDAQHNPTMAVKYTLKLAGDRFILQ